MDWLSGEVLGIAAAAVGAAALFAIARIWTDAAKAAKARAAFLTGVSVAYSVVKELAALTPGKLDDKAALGIKYLRDYLAARGAELAPAQETEAALLFKAMHGTEKAGAVVPPVPRS